jgi:hypothetical protein
MPANPNQFEKDFIETDKKVNLMESALSGRILKIFPFQMMLINGSLFRTREAAKRNGFYIHKKVYCPCILVLK